LMHVNLGVTMFAISSSRWGLTSMPPKWRKTLREQSSPSRTTPTSLQRAKVECTRDARHDPRRHRQISSEVMRKRPPHSGHRRPGSRKPKPMWWIKLPARRFRRKPPNGMWNRSSRRDAHSSTAFPVFIASQDYWGNVSARPTCPCLATTSSHSGRDDSPSRPHHAVCGSRRCALTELSTQLRRQHDFLNMLERERLESKEDSRRRGHSMIPYDIGKDKFTLAVRLRAVAD